MRSQSLYPKPHHQNSLNTKKQFSHQSKQVSQEQKKGFIQPKWKKLKQQCKQQNRKFKLWAQNQSWKLFHSSHYDWWAFPIDSNSGSYGSAYKVEPNDLLVLKSDPDFIQSLKSNATLVSKSWGWDLLKGRDIENKREDQKWQRWPIRLSKMCRSLQIFGADNKDVHMLFVNAIKYGVELLQTFKKFTYGGKDLTSYFYEKYQQICLMESMGKKAQSNSPTKRGQKQQQC